MGNQNGRYLQAFPLPMYWGQDGLAYCSSIFQFPWRTTNWLHCLRLLIKNSHNMSGIPILAHEMNSSCSRGKIASHLTKAWQQIRTARPSSSALSLASVIRFWFLRLYLSKLSLNDSASSAICSTFLHAKTLNITKLEYSSKPNTGKGAHIITQQGQKE